MLEKIIARLMKMLIRLGYLVEEQGVSYLVDIDSANPLRSLQAASCTYRIALGPRVGQKVLSLRTVPGRDEKTTPARCAEAHGFSLHAAVCCVGRISVLAPHAKLRAAVVPGPPKNTSEPAHEHASLVRPRAASASR